MSAASAGPPTARHIGRYAVAAIVGWLLVAGAANLAVPQLERVVETHVHSFLPTDSVSSVAARRSSELLGVTPSDNLTYVLLERDQPLIDADRRYYDRLVTAMRGDTAHVGSVADLWTDPATAAAAESDDGHAVTVMTRLQGMVGTSQAGDSVAALRATITRLGAPHGLAVYVTGPGATVADEFTAIDRQMLRITAATVGLILLLLLIVYRSPVAATVPLMSVGLALAVARPLVAALGGAGLVEVSLFSVALLAAMMLGAGTDYSIFLIGRYHEGRRRGVPTDAALIAAYRGVAPVIVGSALTIAAALACLSSAQVGVFRSAGLPCAVAVLVAMFASLTLTPALILLTGRRRWLEPKRARTMRRWRRIGVTVVRWPAPVLTAAGALIVALALPVFGMHIGWNEPAATPAAAESNRGYQAAGRHFRPNHLLPAVLTIATDHDIRNPAGLIAVERITSSLMDIPGVRTVQSASRPTGVVPDEATLSGLAGTIGRQLDSTFDALDDRLSRLSDLDNALGAMSTDIVQLSGRLQTSVGGLRQIGSAGQDIRSGLAGLQTTITDVSGYVDPLRIFVSGTPDCPNNPICSAIARVVQPVDDVIRDTGQLATGTAQLIDGSAQATDSLAGVTTQMGGMAEQLRQARAATADLADAITSLGPQVRILTDYLQEIDTQFQGSAAAGFYLPQRALADPRLQAALDNLISRDGRATYLLVYGDGAEWSTAGAIRARAIETAVDQATKEGTLIPTAVYVAGVGPATLDLQYLVTRDLTLLISVTLALVFLIVALLLRSPVAGVCVVGTVAISYAAALGASVLIWQHLLHQELHWAVIPISFIALVAVGSDYNLLLAMRIREEARVGLGTGMIRAFGHTGGVVTIAGIVFGITMFALASSSVLSVAQIGVTIGVGLLIDTLVVRTFILPALVALLGRWFWWPKRIWGRTWPRRAVSTRVSPSRPPGGSRPFRARRTVVDV